jgi:hypothetical protein
LTDSVEAAKQAADMIIRQLEPGETPGWALAFCGGRHDRHILLRGLRSAFGGIDIVGGSAVGTITGQSLGYSGYECAVAVFLVSSEKPAFITLDGLDRNETDTGRRLGTQLRETAKPGDTVFVFYDSIRKSPPPELAMGSRLMDGMAEGLAGMELVVVGAGTIGDFQMSDSFVFDGRRAVKHAVVAAVLPSEWQSRTTIMHGCMPVSPFMEITRIEGAVLYELDGRPALDMLLDLSGGARDPGNLSLSMTIGEKHGDLYAPYDESLYVNRLILGSNPAEGSVTLFEADFHPGTKIQIMSRDNQLMLESVSGRTRRLIEDLAPQQPFFALYIDCAGRSRAFSGAETEEASLVQQALGEQVPLLGFYSGVEIAPLLGRSRPLDWTGVLTLLTMGTRT